MAKPALPKGTRDFKPLESLRRKYIFDTIEEVFSQYAYLPIETPAMETLETLTGKYGDEGDKLLFKILNNGDFLDKADQQALLEKNSTRLAPSIAKRGLRYDLTVPFARFVVMHQHEIQFPFKRYQIQPVWRADRPQKGRYQEFYQCDVDVVGSDSLLYEAELVQIYDTVFKKLGIDVIIKLNNRKILYGIAETAGVAEKFVDVTVALDKLDKVGKQKVAEEFQIRGISDEAAQKIFMLVESTDIDDMARHFAADSVGSKGVDELQQVLSYLGESCPESLKIDFTLARGLSYYTGCIFEVVTNPNSYPTLSMGSIGGGGRYDDLTSSFGLKGVSGVGVSFGAERIYDVMTELRLFPKEISGSVKLIFLSANEACLIKSFEYARKLRNKGISTDVYPSAVKLARQMKYTNDRAIPYAAILGEKELENQQITLKNMDSGEQKILSIEELENELLLLK